MRNSLNHFARRAHGVLRVGTHNIMDGHCLPSLLTQYVQQQRGPNPLDVLCIQESVPNAAAAVAKALGPRFAVVAHSAAPRQAIVYDRTRLRPRGMPRTYPLPVLNSLPMWQRLYTRAGELRHALVCRFFAWRWKRRTSFIHGSGGHSGGGGGGGDSRVGSAMAIRRRSSGSRTRRRKQRSSRVLVPLTVANFHLDAGGDNEHRAAQLQGLSAALAADARRDSGGLVACGDTNAFEFDAAKADAALKGMLVPLRRAHGARDAHAGSSEATHFFARAREPKLGHRIAVAAGKLGIDFPRRYDVVVSAFWPAGATGASSRTRGTASRGRVSCDGSDHDLVWAAMRVGRTSRRG
jgi:hypothetical protein